MCRKVERLRVVCIRKLESVARLVGPNPPEELRSRFVVLVRLYEPPRTASSSTNSRNFPAAPGASASNSNFSKNVSILIRRLPPSRLTLPLPPSPSAPAATPASAPPVSPRSAPATARTRAAGGRRRRGRCRVVGVLEVEVVVAGLDLVEGDAPGLLGFDAGGEVVVLAAPPGAFGGELLDADGLALVVALGAGG